MSAQFSVDPGPGVPSGDLWKFTPQGSDLDNGWRYFTHVQDTVKVNHASSLDNLANRSL